MAITRLQRRRKRTRLLKTLKTKNFKKMMFVPVIKKINIEEVKSSFLTSNKK